MRRILAFSRPHESRQRIFAALPLVSMRSEHVVFDSLDGLLGASGRRILKAAVNVLCSFSVEPDLFLEKRTAHLQFGWVPAGATLTFTYTEVWLWHESGKFQLDTLTEGQD